MGLFLRPSANSKTLMTTNLKRQSKVAILLAAPLFALAGCSKAVPKDAFVRAAAGPNCTVVSYGKFEELPRDGDLHRVTTKAELDCTAEGSKTPTRLQAQLKFAQYQDWFSKPWNAAGVEYARPTAAQVAAAEKTIATARLPYSDGPTCNALVAQVVETTVPCLEKQGGTAASQISAYVDRTKLESRYFSAQQLADSQLLMQHDQTCVKQWQFLLKQMTKEQQVCIPPNAL